MINVRVTNPKPDDLIQADAITEFNRQLHSGELVTGTPSIDARNPFNIPRQPPISVENQIDTDIEAAKEGIQEGEPRFVTMSEQVGEEITRQATGEVSVNDLSGRKLIEDGDIDAQLRIDEGVRAFAYDDATSKQIEPGKAYKGNATVGVGAELSQDYNIKALQAMGVDVQDLKDGIVSLKPHQIDALFAIGKSVALKAVRKAAAAKNVAFDTLPYHVQKVLYNMAFNMGEERLAKFTNMFAAAKNQHWDRFVVEMADSAWWGQVGDRAHRLASSIYSDPEDLITIGRDNYRIRMEKARVEANRLLAAEKKAKSSAS